MKSFLELKKDKKDCSKVNTKKMIQIYIKHFKEKLQLLPIELLFRLFFYNFPFRIQYADDPDPQP